MIRLKINAVRDKLIVKPFYKNIFTLNNTKSSGSLANFAAQLGHCCSYLQCNLF